MSGKRQDVICVIQQGWSTGELYAHMFDTLRDAREYRKSAEKATYATSKPIKLPARLAAQLRADEKLEGALCDFVESLLKEVAALV